MPEEHSNRAFCVVNAAGEVVGSSQESYWNAVEDSRDKVLLAARDYFKQCLSTLYGDEDVTKADVSYAGHRLQRGTCLPDNELNELNKRVEFAEERLRINAEVFGEMDLGEAAMMMKAWAWMQSQHITFAQLVEMRKEHDDPEISARNKHIAMLERELNDALVSAHHAKIALESMGTPAERADMVNVYAWLRASHINFADLLDLQRDAESWRKMQKDSSRGGHTP